MAHCFNDNALRDFTHNLVAQPLIDSLGFSSVRQAIITRPQATFADLLCLLETLLVVLVSSVPYARVLETYKVEADESKMNDLLCLPAATATPCTLRLL